MSNPKVMVLDTVHTLLKQRNDGVFEVTLESRLYEDLRMDSLELAELSAILEDGMGRDPYSDGLAPETVGEVVAYYDA